MMDNKVLFARIGCMKYYQGSRTGDEKVIGGGSDKEKHEINNFGRDEEGILYGYIGTDYDVTLERIDGIFDRAHKVRSVDGVLVIFIHAKEPKGQVVLGWYDNATVYRERKKRANGYFYHAKARVDDSVLIPIDRRDCELNILKKGSISQRNRRYYLDKDGYIEELEWMGAAIDHVKDYSGPNLLDPKDLEEYLERETMLAEENNQIRLSGQGYIMDSIMKKKIEDRAMETAIQHYEDIYHVVDDVSRCRFKGEAFDIRCKKVRKRRMGNGSRPDTLRVEVKGTQLEAEKVFLTPNEVRSAKKHDSALFICHSIKWDDKNKEAFGGEPEILDPWNIERDGTLKPTQYSYALNR